MPWKSAPLILILWKNLVGILEFLWKSITAFYFAFLLIINSHHGESALELNISNCLLYFSLSDLPFLFTSRMEHQHQHHQHQEETKEEVSQAGLNSLLFTFLNPLELSWRRKWAGLLSLHPIISLRVAAPSIKKRNKEGDFLELETCWYCICLSHFLFPLNSCYFYRRW